MRHILLLSILLILAPQTWAVVRVADLYEAQVPVADQGEAERSRALTEALGQVAMRVSGLRQAAQAEAIREAAGDAQRLVQQYRYVRGEGDALMFLARFDPRGVDALLEGAGLPRWGQDRPLTLVWLALQDGQGRTIAGADSPGPAGEALREGARGRGLPTVLPLMDLEEQNQVRFTDIWGGFHDTVVAASRRYGAEAVLIGRVDRLAADHWQARWTLVLQEREYQWKSGGERLEAAVSGAVDELAQILAGRFALRAGGPSGGHLRLSITDVRTLEDYARVARALGSRELIRQAQLREVGPNALRYDLQLQGDVDNLRRQLALSEQLAPVDERAPPPGGAAAAEELRYRLLP